MRRACFPDFATARGKVATRVSEFAAATAVAVRLRSQQVPEKGVGGGRNRYLSDIAELQMSSQSCGHSLGGEALGHIRKVVERPAVAEADVFEGFGRA